MKTVMVAMSGGVDSAVTAKLVKNICDKAIGVTLAMFDPCDARFYPQPPEHPGADAEDARAIASLLGMEHYTYDYHQIFAETVLADFVTSYQEGLTPNPCIVCNQCVKFGVLQRAAADLGCDYLATGHYARIEQDTNGRFLLKKAACAEKDQSYVLYTLTQDQLAHTLFPLGEYTKEQVRRMAADLSFPISHKKDSQDICFIPDGDYVAFLERYAGITPREGTYRNQQGDCLGMHNGAIRYTIGQRKGLGIALGRPAYVIAKDMKHNTVTLGHNEDLFVRSLDAGRIHWIPFDTLSAPMRVTAKIRYQHTPAPATVEQTAPDTFHLIFDAPQRAVTPGQSVVLYDGDYVVGGGVITG